jgi:hypothetical protein
MRPYVLVLIVCFLIAARLAYSSSIEIDISQNMNVEMTHESVDNSSSLVKFYYQVYNTGSIPYSARIRTYVYNESGLIFDGWSNEKDFMPGDKKTIETYWHANAKGRYNTTLRIYYGNEMTEKKGISFEVVNDTIPDETFDIRNFRTYEDYVVFEIGGKTDHNNVTVIPSKYVPGWVFDQKVVDEVKGGLFRAVKISYHPTVWQPTDLKLTFVTSDGMHYYEKIVQMKKTQGFEGMFYEILDSLKSLFA